MKILGLALVTALLFVADRIGRNLQHDRAASRPRTSTGPRPEHSRWIGDTADAAKVGTPR
ncbi:MAG: hypothetical protein AUH29_00670 [Candidatus Rokubacteria bacterium 13_1_40CM_69_27]|nr:MAG: hypothetical protein AUH29_00670 [Candidatus Rokubacteria bacterium 13_1_40CM_69_27]OLE39740.1 MAG: hypothetical protein AUG00_00835 [Candidatus Rokubacteria bacterium 13_1_20CM_2_70_7]